MGAGRLDHRIKRSLNNIEAVLQGQGLAELAMELQRYDNMMQLNELLDQQRQAGL